MIIQNNKNTTKLNLYNSKKKICLYKFIKRVLDIILAIIALIFLFPILIIIGIVVKIDSPGSIIFKQARIGQNSKIFYIYKFRTMKVGSPNVATSELTSPYIFITKTGRILRKTSLDELPQIINVLKGDMSFIGPRPVIELEYNLVNLRKKFNVDSIKPGITGLAQINGRDEIDVEEKVSYDVQYMKNLSFKMDIYILFKTFFKVIKAENVKDGDAKNRNVKN